MEHEKIKKVREEIELVMCTYYGKGKANKDRLIDFVETLKVFIKYFLIIIKEKRIIEITRGRRTKYLNKLIELIQRLKVDLNCD